MNENSVDPPDGGYGWVVVISAFFSRGLTTAVLKNFGLFFLEIQNYYNILTSTVSWVTSTSVAMFHLGGEQEVKLVLHLYHLSLERSCSKSTVKDWARNGMLQSQ